MNAQTQNVTRIQNPLSNGQNQIVHHSQTSALVSTESQRAIAEVQAALAIAKSFPRDRVAAVDRILNDCQRSGLAQVAIYQYARGGTSISGPTIRLAESLAQNWGNIQYGVRELSQENGESTVEAFAWDVETNTRQTKIFQVPHVRYTKAGGAVKLIDPRDIYEAVANNGARRLRACILGVIPGDIVEAALQQCDLTLNTYADTSPEGIQKILKAFEKYGVSREALEKRIQCRIESIKPAQIVSLTKIGTSLKEGMSAPADWFEMDNSSSTNSKEDQSDFSALKRQILTIKSIDDLNVCEEQVMDHTNKDERKQLMQLIKAQSQKLQPNAEKNQTSNDVEEKTASTKKPEPVQEEAPPVEEVQVKKPTSAELKKSFAKSLNNAKSEREVSAIESQITANFDLSEADKKYLEANIQQAYDRLKPAESLSVNELIELQKEAETAVRNLKSTKPVINEIKSNNIKNGLAGQIQNAKDITALETVAKLINENKPQMTSAHQQEVLVIYAQRKEILSQADIFGAKEDNTPVARAIARINKCQSQDEINLVWTEIENDPYVSSALTDADRKLIEEAADRREAELQG